MSEALRISDDSYSPEYRLGELIGEEACMRRELHRPTSEEDKKDRLRAGSLGMFLAEIGEYELLRPDEEVHFTRAHQAGVAAAEVLSDCVVPDTDRERLEFIVAQGREAKEVMITSNLRLVVNIAHKFRHSNGDHHELTMLIGEGMIGLNRAVEKFDTNKGYRFSTYATWWIKQSMQRGTSQTRTIRLPTHVVESMNKLYRVTTSLRLSLGREPKPDEIAEAAELSEEKVQELQKLRHSQMASLDADFTSSDDFGLQDILEDHAAQRPFFETEQDMSMKQVEEVAREVISDERGWEILRMRFGIGEHDSPQTLESIGQMLGLTRERVRQIQVHSLRQLKEALLSQGLKSATDLL